MGKTTLTKDALNKSGVSYDSQPTSLPPYIDDLKSDLLDFSCTDFGDLGGLDLDLTIEQLRSKVDLFYRWDTEVLEKANESTTNAIHLTERQDNEPEWQMFYSKHFYSCLFDATKITNKDDRRTARAKFYYERIEEATQRQWTLFTRGSGYQSGNRRNLSMPKPDWMAAFPVYSADFFRTMQAPSKWLWKQQPKDTIVTNFSKRILQHLAAHGLYSVIAHSLEQQKSKKNWKLAHHMCFPWLVMEHKKSKKDVEFCYCQAANGTSAAVLLLQNLCTHATESCLNLRVPPVIGMTTCGREFKVWITYSSPSGIKMDCIWTGDMTKPVPTLQLHCILENIHTWAIRVLRPCISHYIDQWLVRHPLESLSSPTFEAINPGDQFTPTRHDTQVSQQGPEQDTIRVEASPNFFGDLFNGAEGYLEANHQTNLSHVEQNIRSSSRSPSIENTLSYLEQIIDTYKDDDDSDYHPSSRHDIDYYRSSEDDGESDDGSYANTNVEVDRNEASQHIFGRRLFDPFDGDERSFKMEDSWEDYDGSISCESSEIEDEHESLPTLQHNERYQDQESVESDDNGYDYSSPMPLHRTTSLHPTIPLPTTSTLMAPASTICGINCNNRLFDLNFQSRKDVANTVPTKSSKDVETNLSTPSKQISSAPEPPNEPLSQAVSSHYSCGYIHKKVPSRKGHTIRIRFPCFVASDSSINHSYHIPKRVITEPPIKPEATSIKSSEDLFFEGTILITPVPLVRLPGA